MINYLYIALFAFWFAELSTIPQRLLTSYLKVYDFMCINKVVNFIVRGILSILNCVKCLSFWMALTYYWFNVNEYNTYWCIIIPSITSLLSMFICLLFNRLR